MSIFNVTIPIKIEIEAKNEKECEKIANDFKSIMQITFDEFMRKSRNG